MKRASVFLLIVALAVGMAGCEPGFTAQYSIDISSGMGGTVTVPGEGVFRYEAGSVVTLVAEEERGYEFGSWISNAQTIANVYNATTTVTLTRNFYFVIAHFND